MKKILLIDDDPDIIAVTSYILEDANFHVFTSTTAEEGQMRLKYEKPDLILLDVFLPKMQGWELSKQLKSDDNYKHIPIIFFTADSSFVTKSAEEIGGNDFIIKPYEEDELLAIVKKYI